MTPINAGNINPIIPQNLADVAGKNVPAQKAPDTTQGGVVDRIQISNQAKTISKAVISLNTLPDVRTEEVQKAVQNRIVENNRVPAGELAAKLLFEDNIK
jgi:hypothetical protein